MRPHRLPALGPALYACLGLALAPAAAAADADAPFAIRELAVPGRAVQVWSIAPAARCPERRGRALLVLSIEGVPPRERRHASSFPCLDGDSEASAPIEPKIRIPLSRDVIGIDTAEVRADWPGDEILALSRDGVRLLATDGSGASALVTGSGPLPLPARTRAVARIPIAGRWNGRDEISALLPTATGLRWLRFSDGARIDLAAPIETDYRNATDEPPADVADLTIATIRWPGLAMGDDDGDGRSDLFAHWRFGVWVYRTSGDGSTGFAEPPGALLGPTRRSEFAPFSEEDEIRHAASSVQIFVSDLDRDGRADFVVDRTMGGMLESWASTEVHVNPGGGAETGDAARARIASEGAIAGVDVRDLDGDGTSEIFRTLLEFNAQQMLRFVVTGRARVDFSVLSVDAEAPNGLRETWRDSVSLVLDWGTARIAGVFPDLRGDWNGDGRADLVHGDGHQRVALRLGRTVDGGPGFGGRVASQALPLDSASIAAEDLDGDGLQDLVAFDPRSESAPVLVLRNRGVLPGTPRAPTLRPAAGESPPR